MDKYTVLFVDDEEFILKSMKRLFRGDQINIVTAGSGADALEVIRRQPVQLVVSDNIMPGMTGVQLVKEIQSISPDTLRIILSGQSDLEDVIRAINDGGIYRFVLKPWNDVDLKVAVNLALGHFRLMEEHRRAVAKLKKQQSMLQKIREKHPELLEWLEKEILNDNEEYEAAPQASLISI